MSFQKITGNSQAVGAGPQSLKDQTHARISVESAGVVNGDGLDEVNGAVGEDEVRASRMQTRKIVEAGAIIAVDFGIVQVGVGQRDKRCAKTKRRLKPLNYDGIARRRATPRQYHLAGKAKFSPATAKKTPRPPRGRADVLNCRTASQLVLPCFDVERSLQASVSVCGCLMRALANYSETWILFSRNFSHRPRRTQ